MSPAHVVVIGCGAIGAMVAYELSRQGMRVTVLEVSQPGNQVTTKSATGAALGVLMAVCSQKAKGELVSLRLSSLQAYERLIPELENLTAQQIRFNRAGILCLSAKPEAATKCQSLIRIRQSQGFELQWLNQSQLRSLYPDISVPQQGAIFSPSDRTIDPHQLVTALVKAAAQNGAEFMSDRQITDLDQCPVCDWIVITAGLGSNPLLAGLGVAAPLVAVGGQAIRVMLTGLNFLPTIHVDNMLGQDINIVPLGENQYWIGATVEFESEIELPQPNNVNQLLAQAIAICPRFSQAEVLTTWAGYRPRPQFQRSPILGFVPGHPRVLVATGHYRNGLLMAPITAEITKDLILQGDSPHPWRSFSLA